MWAKERLEERAKVLFNSQWVSDELNTRNQKEWVKAVESMGTKFAYAVQIQRKDKG
jgi:hypothetical protein